MNQDLLSKIPRDINQDIYKFLKSKEIVPVGLTGAKYHKQIQSDIQRLYERCSKYTKDYDAVECMRGPEACYASCFSSKNWLKFIHSLPSLVGKKVTFYGEYDSKSIYSAMITRVQIQVMDNIATTKNNSFGWDRIYSQSKDKYYEATDRMFMYVWNSITSDIWGGKFEIILHLSHEQSLPDDSIYKCSMWIEKTKIGDNWSYNGEGTLKNTFYWDSRLSSEAKMKDCPIELLLYKPSKELPPIPVKTGTTAPILPPTGFRHHLSSDPVPHLFSTRSKVLSKRLRDAETQEARDRWRKERTLHLSQMKNPFYFGGIKRKNETLLGAE